MKLIIRYEAGVPIAMYDNWVLLRKVFEIAVQPRGYFSKPQDMVVVVYANGTVLVNFSPRLLREKSIAKATKPKSRRKP